MAVNDWNPELTALRWRLAGPHRGGRSVAVAAHPTDVTTFYMGSTGGGIWKTTNGGVTWDNISDGQFGTASVGALQISPSDPEVLYVGMGECCIRGNVSFGDGVYKSTDGGRHWQSLGLSETRHIARIRIHPTDPDRIYVAALGHAFGPNSERGVYRSVDGGKSFEKILYRDENTGAIDLSLDPRNPRIMYAAMWQARRGPWSMTSGGPGSGLFRSHDGGDTWEEITRFAGLPDGMWGRVGVSISAARPSRIYAMIEAEKGGLYRSDDYGETWHLVNSESGPRTRPWYYTHVFADPVDPETVHVLAMQFWRSHDGGKHFSKVATPHGDHHDLWIDPTNPNRQIHGADGGAAVSFDGGRSWSSIYNQPTAEFYHVEVDEQIPYRLYGAQQDNTTISVPSRTRHAAISERDWYDIGGAESGYIAVRPDDSQVIYAGSSGGGEGGRITRYDHRTREQRDISPWPEKTAGMASMDYTYRFQWTSPIVLSPHDPNILYVAGNRLFKTTDDGRSWDIISPDLSRQDPDTLGPSGGPITKDHTGVEVYGTIFSVAESPLQPGLLWVGTDDGLVHLSRDQGDHWSAVTPPDLPEWSLISIIEPSRFEVGTAYVAATCYKMDDPRPSLWRTRDYGAHWQKIVEGIPDDAYTRVIREDTADPRLLFLGTERGVFVSMDGGEHWQSLQLNLPMVPIHDLKVHKDDLVAATHGRAFWILDQIDPLRQLNQEMSRPIRLFTPSSVVRTVPGGGIWLSSDEEMFPVPVMEWPTGSSFYVAEKPEPAERPRFLDAGQNPPYGVVIYYGFDQDQTGLVTLEIRDNQGKKVRGFRSDDTDVSEPKPKTTRGSHRLVWDLHYPKGVKLVDDSDGRWDTVAPLAPPGTYHVVLTVADAERTASFQLLKDPRVLATDEDLRAQYEFTCQVRDELSRVNGAINRLRRAKKDVEALKEHASSRPALIEAADQVTQSLIAVEEELIQTRATGRDDDLQYPPKLNAKIAYLGDVAQSGDYAPTAQVRAALASLVSQSEHQLGRLEEVFEKQVSSLNRQAAEAGIAHVRTDVG